MDFAWLASVLLILSSLLVDSVTEMGKKKLRRKTSAEAQTVSENGCTHIASACNAKKLDSALRKNPKTLCKVNPLMICFPFFQISIILFSVLHIIITECYRPFLTKLNASLFQGCSAAEIMGTTPWVCLACGEVGCQENGSNPHSVQHAVEKKHALATLADLSRLW